MDDLEARTLDSLGIDCVEDKLPTSRRLEFKGDEGCRSTPTKDKVENYDGVPCVGMEFESEEHAYNFYNTYAGKVGFSIRKDWVSRSSSGIVRSRNFCCSKEGFRLKDKRDNLVKNPRDETRIGCKARMNICIQLNGKFRVTKFVAEHNHEVVTPSRAHVLQSQRKISEIQGIEIVAADKSGIRPKLAHGLMSQQAGGRENLGYLPRDHRNFLRSKIMAEMEKGDVDYMLQYFKKNQAENLSFFYAMQLDVDKQITNIFWADPQMILDYGHFGDVVCFDTTFKTNRYNRPFAPFIGLNHHKQSILFGAALLYDETMESFKWLFETFLMAMSEKRPRTILTDQDAAMKRAIELVFPKPETSHHLCIWHIHQNAVKNLANVFSSSKSFAKDFQNCIYDYEEEEDFLQAWEEMLKKYGLQNNTWLQKLFTEREKWALVYGRDTFCADMKSTQRSESFNASLKRYVNSGHNLHRFFQNFELALADQSYKEKEASFYMSQRIPRLIVPATMLKEARNVYTPIVFEMFTKEYSQFFDVVVNHIYETECMIQYKVSNFEKPREHTVTFDVSNETVCCSCKKFEFVGILCRHAVKVLDLHNIKIIPHHYIMHRWTKSARSVSIIDIHGHLVDPNPKRQTMNRYKELCRDAIRLATRAAESEESCIHVAKSISNLMYEVEEILKNQAPTRQSEILSPSKNTDESKVECPQSNHGSNITDLSDDLENVEDYVEEKVIDKTTAASTKTVQGGRGYEATVRDELGLEGVKGLKVKRGTKGRKRKKLPFEKKKVANQSKVPSNPRPLQPYPHPLHLYPPFPAHGSMLSTQVPFTSNIPQPSVLLPQQYYPLHSVQPAFVRQGSYELQGNIDCRQLDLPAQMRSIHQSLYPMLSQESVSMNHNLSQTESDNTLK